MVEIFKALGDENRLRILNLLINTNMCVCEIEIILNMTQSNVSRHLSKLKSVGIINSKKSAQWVHYNLNDDFKDEHSQLVAYIINKFTTEDMFIFDLERFKKYNESELNCQNINDNKEKVIEFLK